MMKQLRSRKTMRRILQATLILVIPSFVVFYGWGSRSGRGGAATETSVFGSIKAPANLRRTELTTQDWVQAKNQLVSRLQDRLGPQTKASQIEQALPRKEIAEQAVDIYALRLTAEQENLGVTEGELSTLIAQAFPGMGIEQIRQYVERSQQISFRRWLQDVRNGQELAKAQLYIEAAAQAPLPILWNQYVGQKTKLSLQFAEVPVVKQMAGIAIPEDELQKEYEARKKELEEPDKAVYDYVLVRRFDVQVGIQVTDEQVRQQYEKDKDTKYTTPSQATIRHVLIAVSPDASEDETKAAQVQIDKVHSEAARGVPLSELADQYSQDPDNVRSLDQNSTETVKMGGLILRPLTRDQESVWGKEFIDAVFTLPQDTVSSPILTKHGWDVFQVVSRTEGGLQPFEEVRRRVETDLRTEKTNQAYEEARRQLEESRKTQTTLAGIAKALAKDVRETSPVVVGSEYIPGVGLIRDYVTDVLDLQPGSEPTQVMDTGQAYAVLQMKELIPRHIPTLDEVRAKLTEDLQARKALQGAIEEAKSVSERVAKGDQLTSVAVELNLTHGQTAEPFELGSPPPPYNSLQDFSAWVLHTGAGETFLAEAAKSGTVPRSLYVCQVVQKTLPDRKQFLDEVAKVNAPRLYENRRVLLRGYLQDARERLQPRYNQDVVTE